MTERFGHVILAEQPYQMHSGYYCLGQAKGWLILRAVLSAIQNAILATAQLADVTSATQ